MAIEVFISYAHEDEKLMKKLEKQLIILQRHGYITAWHDQKINAGQEWSQEISSHLNKAQIILLLVSTDFMVSNYCYSIEVKEALKRHDAGECRVIPVILRPTFWKNAQFNKLQALPTYGKPVSEWSNKDKAFLDIAEGIQKVVEELSIELTFKTINNMTIEKRENELIKIKESTEIKDDLPDWDDVQNVDKDDPQLSLTVLRKNTKEVYSDLPDWDDVQFTDEGAPLFPLTIPSTLLATKQNIDVKPIHEEINIPPTLTIEQVKKKWGIIKSRIKTRKDGSMIAAILNDYTILDIEDTQKLPIVVLKASGKFHYDTLQKADRSKIIEWAISTELNQECFVRLLPPDKSASEPQVPLPPPVPNIKSTSNSFPPSPHYSSKAIQNNEEEYDF